MYENYYKKVLKVSKGSPNQMSPLLVIKQDLNEKQSEIGVKRKEHPISWKSNQRKIRKNSVIIYFNHMLLKIQLI